MQCAQTGQSVKSFMKLAVVTFIQPGQTLMFIITLCAVASQVPRMPLQTMLNHTQLKLASIIQQYLYHMAILLTVHLYVELTV